MIADNLYEVTPQSMPIPCVDVVALDAHGQALILLRNNEPAKGAWWFPGGRVRHCESREQAARRKLWEECHLVPSCVTELIALDVLLPDGSQFMSHGITTIYAACVEDTSNLVLDLQNQDALWVKPAEDVGAHLPTFVQEIPLNEQLRCHTFHQCIAESIGTFSPAASSRKS